MSQWHKKSRRSDPPNEQNYGYTNVPVKNGTTRAKRYGCAGCKKQLPKEDVNFIVRSDRLKSWVLTRWRAFYVHATGSAYPSDNRSWPYCDDCFDGIKSKLFEHSLKMKEAEANGETYAEVQCSCCGERAPASEFTPYVLRPTRIVHKNGGRGMTAASYPVVRGKSVRALCGECRSEFDPISIEDIEEETLRPESVKMKYANGEVDEDEMEQETDVPEMEIANALRDLATVYRETGRREFYKEQGRKEVQEND